MCLHVVAALCVWCCVICIYQWNSLFYVHKILMRVGTCYHRMLVGMCFVSYVITVCVGTILKWWLAGRIVYSFDTTISWQTLYVNRPLCIHIVDLQISIWTTHTIEPSCQSVCSRESCLCCLQDFTGHVTQPTVSRDLHGSSMLCFGLKNRLRNALSCIEWDVKPLLTLYSYKCTCL